MPGTYTFKPIQANLTHDTCLVGKMDPYCSFTSGSTKAYTEVCKKGGKHPRWLDSVSITIHNDLSAKLVVQVKDHNTTFLKDDDIGSFEPDLKEVQDNGQISKWYPLSYKNQYAGEILMESTFEPDLSYLDGEGMCRKYSKHEQELMEQEENIGEKAYEQENGTYTFKPIQANLTHNISPLEKIHPYCTFTSGSTKVHTEICKKGDQHPHWLDSVSIPIYNEFSVRLVVQVKDHNNTFSKDDDIGNFEPDLKEVQDTGQITKWYLLYHNNEYAGEILMESTFEPDLSYLDGEGMYRKYTKHEQELMEQEEKLRRKAYEQEMEEYSTNLEGRSQKTTARSTVENQSSSQQYPTPAQYDI